MRSTIKNKYQGTILIVRRFVGRGRRVFGSFTKEQILCYLFATNNYKLIATYLLYMYNLISFVSRGKVRKRVLSNLEKPHTPTELSQIIRTHRSTTSRAILALEEKGLVKCITPKEKMGRYYEITELGKKIVSSFKEKNR